MADRDLWCVVRDGTWYLVAKREDLLNLMAVMPVEVVRENEFGEIPALDRMVTLEAWAADGCALTFREDKSGMEEREFIPMNAGILGEAAWLSGAHRDGWIDTDAHLQLDAEGEVAFSLFLPESSRFSNKELVVEIAGNVVFKCEVPRGELYKTAAFPIPSGLREPLALVASYPELPGNGDVRELGFLVRNLWINDIPIDPGLRVNSLS
ncbi:MAG TPA: hypothetical protein VKS60_17545 [Stellaceae bacterium]|nr:hypothetical protein [Stellaceae bacterium]